MRYATGRWDEDRWERRSRTFMASGRSSTTDAAADNFVGHLWNPHSTRSLWVVEICLATSAASTTLDPKRLMRTSTQGTPATSVTPDLDDDEWGESPPATGAVMGLANFSVEPTIASPELLSWTFASTGVHGLTWVLRPEGIRVPPGSGLGLTNTGAVAGVVTSLTFVFTE